MHIHDQLVDVAAGASAGFTGIRWLHGLLKILTVAALTTYGHWVVVVNYNRTYNPQTLQRR